MKEIVIFGSGGLGREVHQLLLDINSKSNVWNILGYYDNLDSKGKFVNGLPVLGDIEDLKSSSHENVIIAIGDNTLRKTLHNSLNMLKKFPYLVHPSVSYNGETAIGGGSIIMSGVFLSINVVVGSFVLVNVSSTIGHDVVINDFVSINPGVRLSGSVKVGENVSLGVGSVLNNNIHIIDNVKIGPGSVVMKSIEKEGTYFGNPARLVLAG